MFDVCLTEVVNWPISKQQLPSKSYENRKLIPVKKRPLTFLPDTTGVDVSIYNVLKSLEYFY